MRSAIELAAGPDASGRVGFCIDTCHAFAAGYDLGSAAAVEDFLGEVDRILGLDSIASVLKETESPKIEINAFVSPKVKKATQAPLSEKRAKAVSDYFAAQGIPSDRLSPSGMGIGEGTSLMADPGANGRIEIVVPAVPWNIQ